MAKRKNPVPEEALESGRQEPKFSRGQILASARYRNRKDLVSALLEEDGTYTMEEVSQKVDQFMKGKVK